MIVVSPSVALSAVSDLSANNPIIGYRNLLKLNGIAADEEDANYPAANLANPSTALRWQGETTAEQHITFAVSAESKTDYLGIARHNFGSGQVAVSVEYPDPGNPGLWLELIGETLLADDSPIIFRFEPTFLSHIRLRLQPSTVVPRAAVVYVGALLVVQRRIYVGHTPIPYGRSTRAVSGRAESGDFLGRIVVGESLDTAVSLQNLTPDWYRAEFDPFVIAAKEAPFFFGWRPAQYPLEVGYAWLTNDPRPVNQRANGMMQIDLQMGGVAL